MESGSRRDRFGLTVWLGLLLGLVPAAAAWAQPAAAAACPPLLQQSFLRLQDERPQSLCQYAGKVLLVVNTASYCGFTPQYEGLEALHARYAARGLVVMGFPSNDFGQQEPGSSKEIAELCFNTYGQPPQWNFHKYLVDRQGRPVAAFASRVEPTDPQLMAAVEAALAER
jgi:glutathione peroxidase